MRPGPRGADLRRRLAIASASPRRSACRCTPAVLRAPRRPRPPVADAHAARRPGRARRHPPHLPAVTLALARRTPWAAPSPARGAPRCRSPAASSSGRRSASSSPPPSRSSRPTSVQPATAARRRPSRVPRRRRREALRRPRHRRRHPAQPLRRPRPARARCTSSTDEVDRRPRGGAHPHVTIGLRDDPIQPLVIRANLGDCVEIKFTQPRHRRRLRPAHRRPRLRPSTPRATPSATTRRPPSPTGQSRTYKLLGARATRDSRARTTCAPAPATARPVAHGLFGALVVEPAGSTYLDMNTGEPTESGWEATIVPGDGNRRSASTSSLPRGRRRGLHASRDQRRRRPADGRPAHRRPTAPGRARSTTAPSRSCTAWTARRGRGVPTAPTRSATRRRRCRAATWATRRRSASSTPAARCSTSTTCTAAASAGASTRRPDPSSTTATPA